MRSQQDRKMGFCEFKKIRRRYHVAAGFTWLATTFFLQKQVIASLCFAAAPFRKRSRLLRLLGCKRPPVASAALPIACGVPAPARVRMWILLCGVLGILSSVDAIERMPYRIAAVMFFADVNVEATLTFVFCGPFIRNTENFSQHWNFRLTFSIYSDKMTT